MKVMILMIQLFVLPYFAFAQKNKKQFLKIPASFSHIKFVNNLDEFNSPSPNDFVNSYNGAGIAVGDINNDGLVDLYFTSNTGEDKLYLNIGNFQFKDISAGLGKQESFLWKTGVTMADINNDGYLDIYVCCSGMGSEKSRRNKLYINNKNLSFIEEAEKFGIDDHGYSTQATFFDLDNDGDLDLYVLNNSSKASFNLAINKTEIDKFVGDKLYRNDNGYFVDVTMQAGISQNSISLGLGIVAADLNNDGWCDLYVANDFMEHDYIYLNKHNGTFSESTNSMLGHMPISSMGVDIADFNNDGLLDIMTLEMLPESLERQKLFLSPDNYEKFSLEVKNGFHYQYMRNMLQLNNGNGTFSEIGQLAGISSTDWSWASLFADFNNDGFKDLLITNGYMYDINNKDYIKYGNSRINGRNPTKKEFVELVRKAPVTKLSNYIFENNKNLTFSNKTTDWGIDDLSFSNGAVYADLDNDGDLDIVISNINETILLYKNQNETINKNRWIELQLVGEGFNKRGYGTKMYVYCKGDIQFIEHTATRGFQSSITDALHFGLGQNMMIDSLKIVWGNGKIELRKNVKSNQRLLFYEKNSLDVTNNISVTVPFFNTTKPLFDYTHIEVDENDFKRQYLLNCMLSKIGPRIISADINKDGYTDYFAFGSAGVYGTIFICKSSGGFSEFSLSPTGTDSRVSSAVFFDSDNDGDQDLYLAMGGYSNFQEGDNILQDILLLNDGNGKFYVSLNALPSLRTSKSCVTVLDFNNDGFKDLFIGGRVVPGSYPTPPESYLLQNDGKGHFNDVTEKICPSLHIPGMFTDAVVIDINHDKIPDLITVGEWMNIEVWLCNGKELINKTSQFFEKSYLGWWNTICLEDIDGDGDIDLIAGNLGLNSQIKTNRLNPTQMLYADFDGNQSIDPFLCFSNNGKTYPFATRDELIDQIFNKRSKFTSYSSYANAAMDDIFSKEEFAKAKVLVADEFKTTLFINDGGKFKEMELPLQAQFSPVYKIVTLDVNKDNKKDILLFGNESGFKLRLGKSDANYGVLLLNKGNHFEYVSQDKSGFCIKGDVRDAWYNKKTNELNVGINGGVLQSYQLK